MTIFPESQQYIQLLFCKYVFKDSSKAITNGLFLTLFSNKDWKYGAIPKQDICIDLVSPQLMFLAIAESLNICWNTCCFFIWWKWIVRNNSFKHHHTSALRVSDLFMYVETDAALGDTNEVIVLEFTSDVEGELMEHIGGQIKCYILDWPSEHKVLILMLFPLACLTF